MDCNVTGGVQLTSAKCRCAASSTAPFIDATDPGRVGCTAGCPALRVASSAAPPTPRTTAMATSRAATSTVATTGPTTLLCPPTSPLAFCTVQCAPGLVPDTVMCTADQQWEAIPECRQPDICQVCNCTAATNATCHGLPMAVLPRFGASIASLTVIHAAITELPVLAAMSRDIINLDVSFNAITILRRATLAGLTRLYDLSLADNPLTLIEPGAFADLREIDKIDLGNHRLGSLPLGLLAGLGTLDKLVLIRAPALDVDAFPLMTDLPASFFANAPSLNVIRLQNNSGLGEQVSSWRAEDFVGVSGLQSLFLDGIPMVGGLVPKFLSGLQFLQHVSMMDCGLRSVTAGALANMPELQFLPLQNNPGLRFIHRELFGPTPKKVLLGMDDCPSLCVTNPKDFTLICACAPQAISANGSCLVGCLASDLALAQGLQLTQPADETCVHAREGVRCAVQCHPSCANRTTASTMAACDSLGDWILDAALACGDCAVTHTTTPPPTTPTPTVALTTTQGGVSEVAEASVRSASISAAGIVGICAAIVALIVLVIVALHRRRAREAFGLSNSIKIQLQKVILECVQTAFQRDYGHAVRDLRQQTVSFEALEVPATAVRKERLIGQEIGRAHV